MSSVACVPMGLPDPRATPRSPLSLVRQVALCARLRRRTALCVQFRRCCCVQICRCCCVQIRRCCCVGEAPALCVQIRPRG